MHFLSLYKKHLKQNHWIEDANQMAVLPALQEIYRHLRIRHQSKKPSLQWLRSTFSRKMPLEQTHGIYLWGSVGSGKTLLLDLLFEQLDFIQGKRKMHFHAFMQDVHKQLNQVKDKQNPLQKIARDIAQLSPLVFLDEFYVSDITDAMIFSNLFQNLFAERVTLLISSNCKPSNLYLHGLQRERFLPAIDSIEKNLQVIELSSFDYRLGLLKQKGLYNVNNKNANTIMLDYYKALSGDHSNKSDSSSIEINHRLFYPARSNRTSIWFHFKELCIKPRAAQDYISIAQNYSVVFVSSIPIFNQNDDCARRFINMIDCFYNSNTILICSAQAEAQNLYQQGNLHEEFKRTCSRLMEMQTNDYLQKSKNMPKRQTLEQ
ncbi:MAG: cell division protein ZapE [Candidatus Oxydemutatoraceae bacterium WSBS_2016_MAG_OTU14]